MSPRVESEINWWGAKDEISVLEICARCIIMFFVALALVRFSGMRPYGKGNAYDVIIAFLIGGILSRGAVGATPLLPAIAGSFTNVALHKIVGKLTFSRKPLDRLVNGEKIILYQNKKLMLENMKKTDITESNIYEELRRQLHQDTLENLEEVYMEKTGEISFIKRK